MSDSIDYHWQRLDQHLSIGHTDAAIGTLKELLALDPELGEAHAVLALCLLDKRRLQAAVHEAGLGLTLAPDEPLVRHAAAEVSIARRDFKEAESQLEMLLAMAPDVARYHLTQARLYDLTKRAPRRLAALEHAQTLAPDDADVLAALSDYHLDANDLSLAYTLAYSALQQNPENTDALVAMGRVLLRRGEIEDARAHALQALRIDSADPTALHLLTMIKARTSPIIGLWWRYNSWMARLGPTRAILVLVAAFILYRIATIASIDGGHLNLSLGIRLT